MIVFDTETTGLVKPLAYPIDQQPHIIEFAAIKLNDETLEEVSRLEFLVKPPEGIKLDKDVMEITKLTDDVLANEKSFINYYPQLVDFFIGERTMVGQNLAFDRNMMFFELKRLSLGLKFPWCPVHICTVERSFELKGYRMKLSELHELATGKPHDHNAHRAMADVEATVSCVKFLRTKGLL